MAKNPWSTTPTAPVIQGTQFPSYPQGGKGGFQWDKGKAGSLGNMGKWLRSSYGSMMGEMAAPVDTSTLSPLYGEARTAMDNQTAAGTAQLTSQFGGDTSDPTFAALSSRLSAGGAAGLGSSWAKLVMDAEQARKERLMQSMQLGTQLFSAMGSYQNAKRAADNVGSGR